MVFHWSLRDNKSPLVSRTLLRILADLSNTVVWIVSIRPLIYKSSCPFTNPLVTLPRAPITIGTIVTFMFLSFFKSLATSWYLSFWSLSFNLYSVLSRDSKVHKKESTLTDSGLCIYHLFVRSNFNFLHNSHSITLPTQSCLVLYSFCANLLHSLIMWLIVSSLSLHNLHLLFCCVFSILALVWFVLMALFCADIKEIQFLSQGFPFLPPSMFSLPLSFLDT